jgi:hypothetical protein
MTNGERLAMTSGVKGEEYKGEGTIFPLASLRLPHYLRAAVSGHQERLDFRMAFDMAGKRVGVEHNIAQDFLREEFQGHHKASQGNCFSGKREYQVIIWLFVNLH